MSLDSYRVKIVTDSYNTATSTRLTTIVATYPRFVHAELLTHRMFSRNSQSSRAYPTYRLLESVSLSPVAPVHWGRNQSGMQASRELSGVRKAIAKILWGCAATSANFFAWSLSTVGAHKQIVNRVIEPYSTITTIITATEWEPFFALRCHVDAQPEIAQLARMIQDSIMANEPKLLEPGDWHIPFSDDIAVSVGKCARVSYLTHDGKRDETKDIALHDQLLNAVPPHASPFEHCACAEADDKFYANFKGFKSYRNFLGI